MTASPIGWRSFGESMIVFAVILLSIAAFTLSKQLKLEREYRDALIVGWKTQAEGLIQERNEQKALAQKLEADRDELLRHPHIQTKIVYYCPPPTPRFGN